MSSRPTWGIASLRQTTDFIPGYIATRWTLCRERLKSYLVSSVTGGNLSSAHDFQQVVHAHHVFLSTKFLILVLYLHVI
jgi:hypothetical protein